MTAVVLEPGFVVEVVPPPLPVVEHIAPTDGSTVFVDPRPPSGQCGGVVVDHPTPSAQWSIPNPTGRLCNVAVYTTNGEQVEADVYVNAALITVTFPTPISGALVAS